LKRQICVFHVILLALVLVACATTPDSPTQYSESEYREGLRKEAFYRFVDECKAARGRIRIEGIGSSDLQQAKGEMAVPGAGERYWCETRSLGI